MNNQNELQIPQPNQFCISVVVTCHSEGFILVPTLRSVNLAMHFADRKDISCELIVVADNIDEETRQAIINLSEEFEFRVVNTSFSNPSESRNMGISLSGGKYLSIVDGDDLISQNWLANAYEKAQVIGQNYVFHPEILISFGDKPAVFPMQSEEKSKISIGDILEHNLWASPVFAHHSVFEKIKYKRLPGSNRFGPEDWVWNIECMAAGVRHLTVEDTVYLYRTSNDSGVNSTHQNSLLPNLHINDLQHHYQFQFSFDEPQNNTEVLRKSIRSRLTLFYKNQKHLFQPLISTSPKISRFLYLTARKIYALLLGISESSLASLEVENKLKLNIVTTIITEKHKTELNKLAWLEPSVTTTLSNLEILPLWRPVGGIYGSLLLEVANFFQNNHTDTFVIIVPWVGIGGADLVTLNYAKALKEIYPESRVVIITTEPPEKTNKNLIPHDIDLFQMPEKYFFLTHELRARLLAQLIVEVQPNLVLNINSPDFFESLRKFSYPMAQRTNLYISFFCFDRSKDGLPQHHAFESNRKYLRDLSGILTDNWKVEKEISHFTGLRRPFVSTHHSPFEFLGNFDSSPSSDKQPESPFKLLWAHRIDRQKRPDVLNLIAQRLESLSIDASIDVYGSSLFMGNESFDFHESIRYRGEFQGGLYGIPRIKEYGAFLVTSEWEGLPTVILQALDIGLPVISSDVGGVSDVIIHKDSGYLVESPDYVDGYIDAIMNLKENPNLKSSLSTKAKKILEKNHSWAQFRNAVKTDLKPKK